MLQRISFLGLVFTLLVGLAIWSKKIEIAPSSADPHLVLQKSSEQSLQLQSSRRREVVEALDRIVSYQHYYRSVYGHFTKLLNRIGFSIPSSVLSSYDVRVAEASSDRLLITAISEVEGKTADVISIDQSFEVRSNISLPMPRPDYLRAQAMKHLRVLRDGSTGRAVDEQGVYRGFFRYEVRHDSRDRRIAFAVGVRPPVVGLQLELAQGEQELPVPAEVADVEGSTPPATGQRSVGNVMISMEQELLAQKIFHGEMGRYARTWSELSQIAQFRTLPSEGLLEAESAGRVPASPLRELEESGMKPGFAAENAELELEIEPISPLEKN